MEASLRHCLRGVNQGFAKTLTGQGLTWPPSKNARGPLEEHPSKLQPTLVDVDMSVAPGAFDLLLEMSHPLIFEGPFTPTATRLSSMLVWLQRDTSVTLPIADLSGTVLL